MVDWSCWTSNLLFFFPFILQIATHAIIFAELRVNNQSHGFFSFVDFLLLGIQLFIVPLRDPESGQPLPGVNVGDLGPKMVLTIANK